VTLRLLLETSLVLQNTYFPEAMQKLLRKCDRACNFSVSSGHRSLSLWKSVIL